MSDASDWEERFSEKHKRKYWRNKTTGKSSWTDPSASKGSSSVAAAEWEEKFSEKHKRKYWRNKSTGKTTWSDPTKAMAIAASTESNDWEEKYSDKHKRNYWRNKTTGKTTWTDPDKSGTVNTAVAQDEWEEKYSEKHKRKYWRNKNTGKSSWSPPSSEGRTASTSLTGTGGTWEEKYSEKYKRKYWRNTSTGQTSWTAPTSSSASTVAQPAPKANNAEVEGLQARLSELEGKYTSVCAERDEWKSRHENISNTLSSNQTENEQKFMDYAKSLRELELSRDELQARCTELEDQLRASGQLKEEYESVKSTLTQQVTSLSESLNASQHQCKEIESELQKVTVERDIFKKLHEETESRMLSKDKDESGTVDVEALQAAHEQTLRKITAETDIRILEEKAKGEREVMEVTRSLHDLRLKYEEKEAQCVRLIEDRGKQQIAFDKLQSQVQEQEHVIRKLHAEADIRALEEKAKGDRELVDVTRALNDMKLKYEDMEAKYYSLCDTRDRLKGELMEAHRQSSLLEEDRRKLEGLLSQYLEQKSDDFSSDSKSESKTSSPSDDSSLILKEVHNMLQKLHQQRRGYDDDSDLSDPPPDVYLDVVYDDLSTPPDSEDELEPPPDDLL